MYVLISFLSPSLYLKECCYRFLYQHLPIGAVTVVIIALLLKYHLHKGLVNRSCSSYARWTYWNPGVHPRHCMSPSSSSMGWLYVSMEGWPYCCAFSPCRCSSLGFHSCSIVEKVTAQPVSPRIIKQRSIAAGFYWALCSGSAMMVIIYFLTTWFQAIEAVSTSESGIRLLLFVLSLVAGSIVGGAITWNAGYYTPPLILGTIIMSVGAGLLTTFNIITSQPGWVGFQFMYGFGLGLGLPGAQL